MSNEEYVLVAFPMTCVPGNSSGQVRTRSHVVFKPRYLVVPRSVAPDFIVNVFWIGKYSQFGNNVPVPAECFSGVVDAFSLERDAPTDFLKKVDLAVPVPLRLDTCTPDHELHLDVTNINTCDRNFTAVLYGELVE